jgi:hypothetical protein
MSFEATLPLGRKQRIFFLSHLFFSVSSWSCEHWLLIILTRFEIETISRSLQI